MQRRTEAAAWRLPLMIAGVAAAVVFLRRVIAALALQLGAAALLMLAALPLCRLMERRMKSGAAAALSLLALGGSAALMMLTILPPLIRQMRQLTSALPSLLETGREAWKALSVWLRERGIDVTPVRDELFIQLSSRAGALVTTLMDVVRSLAGGLGRVLLSPLLAFYLLRDRRRISAALTLLLPVHCRARGVRAAREMRRETAAFLRGQLILSLAVGLLTAIGLLFTGTPGWLLLGLLMGVMELIPYVGPVIAGLPAVLLALQHGWLPALWTLVVLLAVQQIEGAVLSPRLLAGATRLHPMAVLLLISAGGILMGPAGMVAALPVVVAVRGVLRGWRA